MFTRPRGIIRIAIALLIGAVFLLTTVANQEARALAHRPASAGWSLQPPFELDAIGPAEDASFSADGRFLVFTSVSSGASHVVRLDRSTGETTLVSVSPTGAPGNGWNGEPAISADGRYVAFASMSSNLVPGDTIGSRDIFVRDLSSGVTVRISAAPNGVQANNNSFSPDISDDGHLVSFVSHASNLVAGDSNGAADVFVHNRLTGLTRRVSVSSSGRQANEASHLDARISGNGRIVAFTSWASNLVPRDSNGQADVFVHDLRAGTTERVSVSGLGRQGNGASFLGANISRDGRYIPFSSAASNLVVRDTNGAVDAYLHDRATGRTIRVSVSSSGRQGNGDSQGAAVSDDGRYVTFPSLASNLSAGDISTGDTIRDSDVFVRDLVRARTARVSLTAEGEPPEFGSGGTLISPDGRHVGFWTAANIVAGIDPQAYPVLYLVDLST